MILSAIWCWETQANFSKTTKLHKPVGQVQFVGPEKFTSAHYTKFAREIMLLLVNTQAAQAPALRWSSYAITVMAEL